MQTLSIRNVVNMRAGYDTGSQIIQERVPKGKVFTVRKLLFPAPGEIWALLADEFKLPNTGLPTQAYICVMRGVNTFCDLTGEPDQIPSDDFNNGWNACLESFSELLPSLRK